MLGGLATLVRIGTPPAVETAGDASSIAPAKPIRHADMPHEVTTMPNRVTVSRTDRAALAAVPQPTSPAGFRPEDQTRNTPVLTPEQEIAAAKNEDVALENSASQSNDITLQFADPDGARRITTDPEATTTEQKIDRKLTKKEEKLRAINGGVSEATETPNDPADPAALDAFEIALGFQGTDKFSYGKVVKAVQGMQAQEFPQAAAQLQGLEWNKESHYMMNALMKQWGKTDLDAALSAADGMDIRRMQTDARRQAMEGWSSHNPNEAYNMLLAGEDQNPLAEYVSPSKVFRDLAQNNPQAALDKVWNLPETSQQNSALAGVLSALPADERQNAARSLYQQAPTPESQSMLARAVVNDLRIYRPSEAAAFVDSIQEPAIRKSVSSTLIGSWATDDPHEAMGWAASHAPSEQTERDVSSVASRWVRNDPNELGAWLNQQPATATLDPAVQALVRAEQKDSPSTAMGWAESIVDAKDRVTSVRSVAAAWMKTDPAIATPYILNHAELTDKEKQKLLR